MEEPSPTGRQRDTRQEIVARNRTKTKRSGISAVMLLGCAVAGLALPTAGMALGGFDQKTVSVTASGSFASFTPASVDPKLAKLVAERATATGRLLRFTPAEASNRPDRSVTVAVRVDNETARAISVRSAISAARGEPGQGTLVIAPTRYDLGMARGYRSFAQPLVQGSEIRKIDMPDLSSFEPGRDESSGKPSRFNARIALEENGNAGRAPRTLEAIDAQRFDVGGSYRVMRNLDVTAGVRYSQERDRLTPLTDGTRDSQAVYVGTQFRF